MPFGESNPAKVRGIADDDSVMIGLQALVWTLGEPARAQRLLDLTGLTPESLRAGAADPAILGALLEFLAGHEPDLIGCAEAIGVSPARLIQIRDRLAA